jgi:uncharacterized membrane protein
MAAPYFGGGNPTSGSAQGTSLTLSTQFVSIASPIPPPEILAKYEALSPGSMDRILTMAEKQQDLRHRLEARVVDGNVYAQKVGVWTGGVLAFVLIGGGCAVAIWGHNLWGLAAALSAGATVIGNANYQRTRQERERAKKLEPAQKPPQFRA